MTPPFSTDELRKAYLDFFQKKNHRVFPSDSLVPIGDASLLFTGAGMNQFKPYFLGLKKDVKRATSCQKCLRTADLERVGKTAYHHSFFEMLGNFSFGDYFKEEAIAWGWEFVTQILKLPEEKLWVSVYEEDDEAFLIWKNKIGLPESKIIRMGPEDNFWPANAPKDGPNGPCGPCSEIYVGSVPGKGVEIWNLVFTQFDRQSDGSLIPLPQKNIDTGMGLERTASVLQGVESNFDIDIFKKFRAELKSLLKKDASETAHENAVMDQARAAIFCVADGALPSNEGRGYVVRKLIRLGCDHLAKAGAEAGQFRKLVPMVAKIMGTAYPEIVAKQKDIMAMIENEENAYQEVLRIQIPKLDVEFEQIKKMGALPNVDPAKIAFRYYDTYGLPLEIVEERASKYGLNVDKNLFNKMLEEQRSRSRESSKIAVEIFAKSDFYELTEGILPTQFLGYSGVTGTGKLLKIVHDNEVETKALAGDEVIFIFDRTPFYAESGGQIGDTGVITGNGLIAEVKDAQYHEKIVLHKAFVKEGRAETGKNYELSVDAERRADIMKNHTATHLLHAALRKILGEHVKQSGSLVAPDYLRFDFSHFRAVETESLRKIEALVNEQIQKNTTVDKQVMSKDEAMQKGAIAFFGEKYGDKVRVLTIGDFSKELCGGTHLDSIGEIGFFKITSESSIQAGVRRIEAVTGRWAEKYTGEQKKELETLCAMFGAQENSLQQDLKKMGQRISTLKNKLGQSALSKVKNHLTEKIKHAPETSGAKLVLETWDGADVDLIRGAMDYLKTTGTPFTAFLLSSDDEKTSFLVAASHDLVQKGFNAGKILKSIATLVEGNGGGRPDFAVGGTKRLDKKSELLSLGEKEIRRELSGLSGKTVNQ